MPQFAVVLPNFFIEMLQEIFTSINDALTELEICKEVFLLYEEIGFLFIIRELNVGFDESTGSLPEDCKIYDSNEVCEQTDARRS